MALNIKDVEPSNWVDFKLETDPPMEVRLKIRYLQELSLISFVDLEKKTPASELEDKILKYALKAIKDWDLMDGQKELSCTDEVKRDYIDYLSVIFDIKVVDKDENLGSSVINYARNKENFLKNWKPISAGTKTLGRKSGQPKSTDTR